MKCWHRSIVLRGCLLPGSRLPGSNPPAIAPPFATFRRSATQEEMEVAPSSSARNSDLAIIGTLPFMSAPSSPRRSNPFHSSIFLPDAPPRGGIPSTEAANNDDEEFAFDFNEALERSSLSADELFDGGKIRPLRPPPPIENNRSPRGRDRARSPNPRIARRGSRSHSPLRGSDHPWELEDDNNSAHQQPSLTPKPSPSKSSRRWSLKDFLLFRSASEGRAGDKNRLKYMSVFRRSDDSKNRSFRSSSSEEARRKGAVSAHEQHYTANRAILEDMKKKTFLPYKQGILGSGRPRSGHRFWFFGS